MKGSSPAAVGLDFDARNKLLAVATSARGDGSLTSGVTIIENLNSAPARNLSFVKNVTTGTASYNLNSVSCVDYFLENNFYESSHGFLVGSDGGFDIFEPENNSPRIDRNSLQIFTADRTTEISPGGSTESSTVVIQPKVFDPNPDTTLTVFVNLIEMENSFAATQTPDVENADGAGNLACSSETNFNDCASKVWFASLTGDFSNSPFAPMIEIPNLPGKPGGGQSYKLRIIATDGITFEIATSYGSSELFGLISANHPDSAVAAKIADKYLFGFLLSETIGWIKLRNGEPAESNCAAQVSDQTAENYGVLIGEINPLTGNSKLCGFALSETFGWISFRGVDKNGQPYGVELNSEKEINGWAFSEIAGWIKF